MNNGIWCVYWNACGEDTIPASAWNVASEHIIALSYATTQLAYPLWWHTYLGVLLPVLYRISFACLDNCSGNCFCQSCSRICCFFTVNRSWRQKTCCTSYQNTLRKAKFLVSFSKLCFAYSFDYHPDLERRWFKCNMTLFLSNTFEYIL